jgi:cytochrome c oxidase subunit 4
MNRPSDPEEARGQRRRRRRYLVAWLALLALLVLTVLLAGLHLGRGNLVMSLVIAAAKAAIVGWVFMALSEAPALLRIVAATGLAALLVLSGLSAVDLGTRLDEPAMWSR